MRAVVRIFLFRMLQGWCDDREVLFESPVSGRSGDGGRRLLTVGSGTEQGRGRVIEWDIPTRQPVRVIRESVRAAWFVGDDVVV